MEFDAENRLFCFLREMELPALPHTNDKLVFDLNGIGYVFKVYDVHISDHSRIDVNVIRMGTVTEYNASGFPDIDHQLK